MIGVTQRRISSTARGRSSGWARSRSHSPRCSQKASKPPLIATTNDTPYAPEKSAIWIILLNGLVLGSGGNWLFMDRR